MSLHTCKHASAVNKHAGRYIFLHITVLP